MHLNVPIFYLSDKVLHVSPVVRVQSEAPRELKKFSAGSGELVPCVHHTLLSRTTLRTDPRWDGSELGREREVAQMLHRVEKRDGGCAARIPVLRSELGGEGLDALD